jgi:O-succinylbenzoate synthase
LTEIVRVDLREIGLQLREPFRISSGVTHARRIVLAEVHDADGTIGWGECVAGETPQYSAETVDTAWLAITTWIVPAVLGVEFADPEAAARTIEARGRGHRMAKATIEQAIWDLHARRRGVSLSALLGGSRSRVATGISLGIQASPDALAAKVDEAVRAGYRRIKIKIRPGADTAFLEAAREACPSTIPLSVDANAAYTMDDLETLRALDGFGLLLIEQPLDTEDLVRHAELQRHLRTPICLDESITSRARAEDMATLGSGRIINIKPGRVGGHAASRAIHDVAAARGIPVWCGGMLESGIGRAHNVALASLANFTLPGDLSPSARYWDRDVVRPAWTMEDGHLHVPTAPGIGVDVDRDFLEQITQRTTSLDTR